MKTKLFNLAAGAFAVGLLAVPEASATDAAYVHVLKKETPDTRLHIGEIEAFANGDVPDELGGATGRGLATSTNDIGDGTLTTFGDGNIYPVIGTTSALEHGGGNRLPNNALEGGGAVWSTANNQAANAQYTLDLGGTFDVTTIRLWPRNDACCDNRWRNLEIQLLDENQNPIEGTLNMHAGANDAIEFNFDPSSTDIEEIVLEPALTFPTEDDPVVLSSAAAGTPVGLLFGLNEFDFAVAGAEFSLIAGDGDTNNGLYTIGGPDDNELMVDASLTGEAGAMHSVRVFADAGDGPFEQAITFTVTADSDSDDLIDAWELMFGELGDFSTGGDAEPDGLNDEDEFALGTDPSDDDSDDDGSKDGDEIANMTDPADPDSDDDGLNDGDEATAESDPLNPDTDGDTLSDGDEVEANPFSTDPTMTDTDGDGFADNLELTFNSDPTNPNSTPSFGGAVRFIEVVKVNAADTRMHISEFEIFAPGDVPDGVGGGNGGLSSNDLIDTAGLAPTRYLGVGSPTTTTQLEHGGGSSQTNNNIEGGGAVWSTANGLAEDPRYVLDLGASVGFGTVRIWARGDACCQQRFENLTINVWTDDGAGNPGVMLASVEALGQNPPGNVGPLEVTFDIVPIEPLRITEIVYDTAADEFTLTWNSIAGRVYAVFFSTDLTDFGSDVDDGIDSQGESTTYSFENPVPGAERLYFRVEDVGGFP